MGGKAPRTLRTWWIWTIVANFVGIAILLIGWGTNSSLVLALGFIVLVVSLGVRVAAQLNARTRRQ
jgi:predicted cobalt transporter CbtA